jgi:hypothetical protein
MPCAGIPVDDMNSWADSCPTKAGYDELGNYMTYNSAICFAAVGHVTRGQAERMHYVTSERNPVMYAWGQYYAGTSPSPPPSSTWPADVFNRTCKVSGAQRGRDVWQAGRQAGRRYPTTPAPSGPALLAQG